MNPLRQADISPPAPRLATAGRCATVFVTLFLFCGGATASEIRAAIGGWHFDIAGTVDDGGLIYDFEDDLDLRSQGEVHLEFEWRTPPGWWPDVLLSWSRSKASGRHVEPGTPPVVPEQMLSADAENSDVDLTLRYPIRLGDVRVAPGLSLKRVASDVHIEDSSQEEPTDEQLSVVFPQAHVAVAWPFSNLFGLSATFQGVKYQDDLAYDLHAGVEFWMFDPVLVEAGWQRKRYEVSDGDYAIDATLDGPVLRMRARFPL